MGQTTQKLGLYLPGGGSSGTNLPDEVMDVDRLNDNFKKIDDFAKTVPGGTLVTSVADRTAKFPTPVQGNTVFRTDLGYSETYYGTYNDVSNPGGASPAGWYPSAGAQIYASVQKTSGFQTITTTASAITGLALGQQVGGFTLASDRLKIPVSGVYDARVKVYGSGPNMGPINVGLTKDNNTPDLALGPFARLLRSSPAVDEAREASGLFKFAANDNIGLGAFTVSTTGSVWGGAADTASSTGFQLIYVGPPRA